MDVTSRGVEEVAAAVGFSALIFKTVPRIVSSVFLLRVGETV